MKNLININSWCLGHLSSKVCASDFYYIRIVRKLYNIVRATEVGKDSGDFMCYRLAMAATYYFEDVISGFGIWETFTSKHKELYGKYLPFYDVDEENYYQDEINPEDVCLLVWMILQKENETAFLNPENPYLVKMAMRIYNELDAEFEKTPINVEIFENLKNGLLYEEFFGVKHMLSCMINKLYLFEPFLEDLVDVVEDQVLELLGDDLDPSMHAYATDAVLTCCEKIGPLALYAKDWLSTLLAHWGMQEESEHLAAIESLPYAIYLLKEYDSETIYLEDIAGKEYIISRNSFNELPDSTLVDNKSLIATLVKYKGKWEVNGITTWSFGRTLFDAYKEQSTAKESNFILYKKVMEVNQNHPLLYFKDFETMLEWFDKHLGTDKKNTFPDGMKTQSFFAVYADKEQEMAIIPYGALAICDKHNPYYNKKKAEKESFNMIVSELICPKKMLHYLIEHNMLPDACINSSQGSERGKELVQENMDFIARFIRTDNY